MTASTLELTERIRELERSNTELEQFAYVASHDLQEPVRTVQSCIELFLRRHGDGLDESALAFLRHAMDASEHMKTLLEDLLAYARIGRDGTSAQPVDLDEVVRAVLAAIRSRDDQVSVDVGPLPTVTGNRSELEMVIRNLVSNAVKFRAEGRPPRIEIRAELEHGRWTVSVADNGIGIASANREEAFDMFRRLNARSRYPGTGMGLAMCRRVVESHGGRIWADDTPLGGVAIRVELPTVARSEES